MDMVELGSAEVVFVQAAVSNPGNGTEAAYALIPVPKAEEATLRSGVEVLNGIGVGTRLVAVAGVKSEFVSPALPSWMVRDARVQKALGVVASLIEDRPKTYALGKKDQWTPGTFVKASEIPKGAIGPREKVMARAKV